MMEHSKLLDCTMAGPNAKTVAELLQRSKAMREEQRPLQTSFKMAEYATKAGRH